MAADITISGSAYPQPDVRLNRLRVAVLHSAAAAEITVGAVGEIRPDVRLNRLRTAIIYDPSQSFVETFISGSGEPTAIVTLFRQRLAILVPALHGRVRWWTGTEWLIAQSYGWDGTGWASAVIVRAWDGSQWVDSVLI